MKTQR
jgi:hypothetical protein